jgi:7-alpha-hydroxysteroid dehydrogenase
VHRLGEPDDIALGALWLCSPAGSYVTGKVIEIDGGLEAGNLALNLPDL